MIALTDHRTSFFGACAALGLTTGVVAAVLTFVPPAVLPQAPATPQPRGTLSPPPWTPPAMTRPAPQAVTTTPASRSTSKVRTSRSPAADIEIDWPTSARAVPKPVSEPTTEPETEPTTVAPHTPEPTATTTGIPDDPG